MNPVLDIIADIGLAGALDILMVTALVYGVLAWMQANRMRNLLRGIVTVMVLYLGARFFELDLTAASLETVLVIVAVAAIVLYGGEIRRLVERMSLLGALRTEPESNNDDMNELAQVLFELGTARVGALVVLEGREPLDQHINAGEDLDGVLSAPLLHSVFDPHSIGHDGALIVRGGRVLKFACHLPLSSNQSLLGHRGTRHAAALGLSEQSDALCIAVSEERGTVTVCERGVIDPIPHADALVERLLAFRKEGTTTPPARHRIKLSPAMLAASLVIAMFSWIIIVHGARPVNRTYVVAVETINVPDGLVVQAVYPKEVTVTVTAAGHEFYFVKPKNIRVTIPVAGLKPGQHAVTIGGAEVERPKDLDVVSVEPGRVSLSVIKK